MVPEENSNFKERTEQTNSKTNERIPRKLHHLYRYQPIANMLVVSNHLEYGGRTLTKKRDLF